MKWVISRIFGSRVVFDLSKPSSYEFNPEVISDEGPYLTKGIVYGPNGSGKTNLGLAIFDIVTHLTDNNILANRYEPYLSLYGREDYVSFSYAFIFSGHELVYEYKKASLRTLLEERILVDGREVFCFDYPKNSGHSAFKGSEALDLSGGRSSQVSRVKFILGTAVLVEDEVNSVLLEFGSFIDRMLLFYSLDSRGYQGFSVGADRLSDGILRYGTIEGFEGFLRENGLDYSLVEKEVDGEREIYCRFPKGDINFFRICSTGTSSLTLFYYWYLRLRETSFVFVDEFDAYYHFELAESIVRLLRGLTGTQVFLTTHNTDLLSNDLLRPDCFFQIKDEAIMPLSESTDKELRKAHNLQKMYKAGAFL